MRNVLNAVDASACIVTKTNLWSYWVFWCKLGHQNNTYPEFSAFEVETQGQK